MDENGDSGKYLATFKCNKAISFVKEGYSVEWRPDESAWMTVYMPGRLGREPLYRAHAGFSSAPSSEGINAGCLKKLLIQRKYLADQLYHPGAIQDLEAVLYDYDCGPHLDRLMEDQEAQRLYDVVIKYLNRP